MKKVYIFILALVITGVSYAQYSTKQNAVLGITSPQKSVTPISHPKDIMVDYFVEDFEGGIGAWSTIDGDGDGSNWVAMLDLGGTAHGGTNAAQSESWNGAALTPNNYLISPQIDLTSASGTIFLKYFVAGQDPDWESEHYGVMISTTGTAVGDFSMLYQETLPIVGDVITYFERSLDLSAYAGQNIYIAFRHFACTDMFRLNLDDVSVYQETTTDGAITGVVAPTNESGCTLTASENVTVTIFNNGGVALTGFQASYSINGGAPVTETVSASIAPATSYDFTFATTADFSTLGYYDMDFDLSITGDANAANDSWSSHVRNTDGVITFEVQSDGNGDQTVYIYNIASEEVWYHGNYQWYITTTDDICVLDDDCYVIEFTAGGDNTVIVDYNSIEIYNQTLSGSGDNIYGVGGGCAAVDANLTGLTFPGFEFPSTDVDITGIVQNIGTDNITSFDVTYTVDGGAASAIFSVVCNIATGETYGFTHNVPFNTAIEALYTIEVTISNVNGGTDSNLANNVLSADILITSSVLPRKVLWEEFSTEACVYCPPVMDIVYPYIESQSNAIMMTHHAGFGTDFLTVSESVTLEEMYNEGTYAPAGMADRHYNGLDNDDDGTNEPGPVFWPGSDYCSTRVASRLSEPAFVSVNIDGVYNSAASEINLTVSGDFLNSFSGTLGVSVWVVEDNVQESASPGQSGATSSPYFHHYPVRQAVAGAYGSAITSGTTSGSSYTKSWVVDVDPSWNFTNCSFIAFVNQIDAGNVNNRVIHNANNKVFADFPVTVGENIAKSNINIYPNPTSDVIYISNAENTIINIYDIIGNLVYSSNNTKNLNVINLSNLPNGNYIVKVQSETEIVTEKIVVNK